MSNCVPIRLLSFLLLVALTATAMTAADEAPPPGWKLVWQDEFAGTQLDPQNWSLCERGTSDWDDTMSKDPRLVEVRNGTLHLHGVVNEDQKKDPPRFLTGGVTSREKFQFHHGRLEVRARFKNAQGAWPAIWLLGSGVRWPEGGEIDIMEHLNFEDVVYQTVHTPYTLEAKKEKPDDHSRTAPISKVDFNTYGIEWDAGQIVFLVNGRKTFTYRRDGGKGPLQWPFTRPMYVILSMQIGGKWVGKENPAHYPAHMEIDWVRAYARE